MHYFTHFNLNIVEILVASTTQIQFITHNPGNLCIPLSFRSVHKIYYTYTLYTVHIQTYIGSVVVSVNPYKQIGIYDSETMEEYKGVNFYELPPHM